jgi:hypothetical protein
MATMVKVPAAGMMPGVASTPERVGSQREETAEEAQHIVRSTVRKERMVSTIMLDNEKPYQQTGGWKCLQQGKPIGEA